MPKKRQPLNLCNDKYKQTDITTYFKVTSKGVESLSLISSKSKLTYINKGNDSDEPVVSPAKKPRPIPSDDECDSDQLNIRTKVSETTTMTTKRHISSSSSNNESDSDEPAISPAKAHKVTPSEDLNSSEEFSELLQSLIAPLETPKPLPKRKRIPLLRQYRPRTRLPARPFPLPSYRCSADTDSEYGSDNKLLSQRKMRNARVQHTRRRPKLLELISSDTHVKIEPIFIDSDDDFEEISTQLKKVPFSPNKNKGSLNNTSRVQEKSEKSMEPPKSKIRVQYQSKDDKKKSVTELESSNLSEAKSTKPSKAPTATEKVSEVPFSQATTSKTPTSAEILLNIPLSQPSTLKSPTSPEKSVKSLLTVHPPTRIATTRERRKPNILKKKSYSDSNLPSRKAEYISTDFLPNSTLKILSPVFPSNSSTNIAVAPKKRATILEDIISSSPAKKAVISLEQGNLSAIRLEPDSTTGLNNIVSSTLQASVTTSNSIQSSPQWSSSKQSLVIKNMETQSMLNSTSQRVLTDDDNGEVNNWNSIAFELFTKITQYVGSHNHLKTMLCGEETELLKRFFSMPNKQYMFVCLKLYTRIHKWYNVIRFADVLKLQMSCAQVRELYKCLGENEFVDCDFSKDSTVELLNLLLRRDLVELCQSFKIKFYKEAANTRQKMIKKLLDHCNSQSTLTGKSTEGILKDRIKDKLGICIKLNSKLLNVFNKVHFLYSFVTDDFETTSDMYFFLNKIHNGDISMPLICIDDNVQIFSSIDEFSRFSDAHECKRAIEDAFTKKEVNLMTELCELAHSNLKEILARPEAPRPSHLKRFTAGHQYTRALSLGTKHLAQHKPLEVEGWLIFLLDQKQYCLRAHGNWYDLLVMVQSRYLRNHEIAVETMIEALKKDYLSDVDRHNLSYRAEAIKNRKTNKISELQNNRICFEQPTALEEPSFIEITAQPARSFESDTAPGKKLKFVKKTANGQSVASVEDTALQYYFNNGFAKGLHCEGSLLATIFFVLFWDIIYESTVPAVFITEIQYYPLDLQSLEFYTNRKTAIDKRLKEIRFSWPLDRLKGFICDIWVKHACKKSYINDRVVNEPEDLYDIILCIGRVTLSKCLQRLISDFKAYHSGLPDLFLWNVSQKNCKFVEVKSERDRLSTKQKLWLNFLKSIGADVEVCYVRNTGSKPSVRGRKVKGEIKKEEK